MKRTSPEAVGLSAQRLGRIHPLMQGYIDQQKLAGLITVVARRGQVAHWECFGSMNLETNQPRCFRRLPLYHRVGLLLP